MIWLLFFLAIAVPLALWQWRAARLRAHRTALLATALSPEARGVVEGSVPLVAAMPPALRVRLEGKITLFLDQVQFHGAGGLEVHDDMRLSIAAQACLLVACNDAWYETLRTVVIYPAAFRSRQPVQDGYVVTEADSIRIGESWSRGPVILSWQDTEAGALDDGDGKNVVFHEFAHQLDDLSGATDGIPVVGARRAAWIEAFDDAYRRSNRLLEIGKVPFLDPYGATAPEELFAVAVEAFFETPRDLMREEPEIYRELAAYFGQDPASWR
ncbi:MAG: M90 family metallopeptidase [Pseudomonadota bacterium]